MSARAALTAIVWLSVSTCTLFAAPLPVLEHQGVKHGFIVVKSEEGKVIATADVINKTHGSRIESEINFHFRDGSVDDETVVFTQNRVFRLITDHHIQKGPSFPNPLDMTIDVPTSQLTWHEDKDGKDQIHSKQVKFPDDLVNGMIPMIAENFPASATDLKLSYVAFEDEPRVVTLLVTREGQTSVDIGGVSRRANEYNIHIQLHGIAGVVAPIIGKQPSDSTIWASAGEAPTFLRGIAALYPLGPKWTIELVSPSWPKDEK
jgi:hypothetical protein